MSNESVCVCVYMLAPSAQCRYLLNDVIYMNQKPTPDLENLFRFKFQSHLVFQTEDEEGTKKSINTNRLFCQMYHSDIACSSNTRPMHPFHWLAHSTADRNTHKKNAKKVYEKDDICLISKLVYVQHRVISMVSVTQR